MFGIAATLISLPKILRQRRPTPIPPGAPNSIFSMLKKKHSTSKHLPRGLEIPYEDRDILVVDKPALRLRTALCLAKKLRKNRYFICLLFGPTILIYIRKYTRLFSDGAKKSGKTYYPLH